MPTNMVSTTTYQPEHIRFASSPEPISEQITLPALVADLPEGTLFSFTGGDWKVVTDFAEGIAGVLGVAAETGDSELSMFTFGNFNVRWCKSALHDDASDTAVWEEMQDATVGSGIFLHVPAEQPFTLI